MKIAIVGSRDYPKPDFVREFVDSLLSEKAEIVSGGARGVDRIAEQRAREIGLNTKVFTAQWEQYGKQAGFIRNSQIIDYANVVVAFWDGVSRGTKDSMMKAAKQNKLKYVFGPDGTNLLDLANELRYSH